MQIVAKFTITNCIVLQ